MSLYQDRQIKGFLIFLILFSLLFVGTGAVLTIYQVNDVEVLWLKHDEAVSSSLLEQGVSKEVIAVAFTNTNISENGRALLTAAGLGKQAESSMRPFFNQFQRSAFFIMLCTVLFFLFVLTIGVFVFSGKGNDCTNRPTKYYQITSTGITLLICHRITRAKSIKCFLR